MVFKFIINFILNVLIVGASLGAACDIKPFSEKSIAIIPAYLYEAGHSGNKATQQFKNGLLFAQKNILPKLGKEAITSKDIQQLHKALNEGASDFGHNGMGRVVAGEYRTEHIIVEKRIFNAAERKKLGNRIWVRYGFWTEKDYKLAQSVLSQSPDEESLLETILRLSTQKKYVNALATFQKIMFFTDLYDVKSLKEVPVQGKKLQKSLEKKVNSFLQNLHEKMSNKENPIKIAAFAHQLVDIHPFADGNGRTSRCLMNLILMHYGYLPVIFEGNTEAYFDACNKVQTGKDLEAFFLFLGEQVKAQAEEWSKMLMPQKPRQKVTLRIIIVRKRKRCAAGTAAGKKRGFRSTSNMTMKA